MSLHPSISQNFEFLGTDYSKGSAYALNKTRTLFRDAIAKGKIPGFKLRAMHITADPNGWASLAREFNTRIIWQYRKNVFKTGLGIYARMVYNDYTATGGIKTEDYKSETDRCNMGIGCSFAIHDWDKFHAIITGRVQQDLEMVRAVKIVDDGRDCAFELPYEDYLYYKEETISDLFTFLGLTPTKFDTFRVKATKDSMCEVVENFDELCEHFYGCPIWQPFLEDTENECRCTKFAYGSSKYCSMFTRDE